MSHISVDPVFLVTNECNTVTSAMRKNARWAQSGVAAILAAPPDSEGSDETLASRLGLRARAHNNGSESPLIAGFAKLRADLAVHKNIATFDSRRLLAPFLDVISAQTTTGIITSAALASMEKFFRFGLVTRSSVHIELALAQLATAITHCRFEATDQLEDDAVLLRILVLMEEILCGPCGDLLSDDSVCEIVETCLSMACQMRRGDILRRTAEMTMIKLSTTVFSRLHALEPEENDLVEDLDPNSVQVAEPQHSPGYENIGSNILVSSKSDHRRNRSSVSNDLNSEGVVIDADEARTSRDAGTQDIASSTRGDAKLIPTILKPYGLVSVREVFRVLVSILDPANFHQYTDSTRILALRLLNVAFEVSGSDIQRHPSLLNLTTTVLSKHLFQLVRYDSPLLLQETLRAILTLLHTCSQYLKLQEEFLLTYLLTSLAPLSDIPREEGVDSIFYDGVPNRPKLVKVPTSHPSTSATPTPVGGRSTPVHPGLNLKAPDIREIMIEAIAGMTRSDSFFTDLFVNYDCAVDRSDLCEDLVGFLCRNAYPDSAQWSTAAVPPLCLEAVLALISSIFYRLPAESSAQPSEDAEALLQARARKKLVIAVTDIFNSNAKKGINLLIERKLVDADSPQSIARFLKDSGRLNKTTLGEYLAKPVNKNVMELFIEDFDFGNKRIDEALREFLCCFRLPGESQQIEQIFEKFASQYCSGEGNTVEVSNNDSAFVLSYAVIMLNTDLHNPHIKKHMTLDQFKRNLRGANDGKDYNPEYLEEIYQAIKSREIIMPDEHDNEESFEYAWRDLLLKMNQAGTMTTSAPNYLDKYMFEATWKPIVTTLAFVFASATDDTVFSRVITGFNQATQIAAHYGLHSVIDHIIACLSKISTLSEGDQSAPTTKSEIVIENEGSIIVSDLSVPFGSDFKAQMASVTLFRIVRTCVDSIHDGWKSLLPSFANLYLYDMISPVITPEFELVHGLRPLARVKPQSSFKRSKAGRDVGLFSTLSSYLTGYNDSPPEPSDDDVDATLCAIDCVNSCAIPSIYELFRTLDEESISHLADAIVAQLPSFLESAPAVKQLFYPVTQYYLELLVSLLIMSDNHVNVVAPKALGALVFYIDKWELLSPEFLSRVLGYTLIVLNEADGEFGEQLDSVLQKSLEVNISVLGQASSAVVYPLLRLADKESWCRDSVLNSEKYWQLVTVTVADPACRMPLFDFIQKLISESPDTITETNFKHVLNVLGRLSEPGEQHKGIKEKKQMEQLVQKLSAALDLLFSMDFVVTRAVEAGDAWQPLWHDYVTAVGHQCVNRSRAVRTRALTYFQRLLLSQELHNRQGFEWVQTFDVAIFPLIGDLLDPEVYGLDPKGMGATRLQTASLLCKVFLQYVVYVQQQNDEVLALWIRILDTLDRLVNSGQKDLLRESVVESLKNVILVMSTSEFKSTPEFWDETWRRIDGFLPGLRGEIEPTQEPKQVAEASEKTDEKSDKKVDDTVEKTDEKTETPSDPVATAESTAKAPES